MAVTTARFPFLRPELERTVDDFKLRNFVRSHPGLIPPSLEQLSLHDAEGLRERLRRRASAPASIEPVELTRRLVDIATPVMELMPSSPDFNLAAALHTLGIKSAKTVYINWRHYDIIDRISLADLSAFFDDIWYPGADDIEIFDDSCTWLLVVPHSGPLGVARLHE